MENAGEEYDTESVEQPQFVPEPDAEPDVYERPGPRVVRDPDPAWEADPEFDVAPGEGPRALRDTDAEWGPDSDEDLDQYPGGTGSGPVPLWAREGPSADRIRARLGWDAEAGADDVPDEASLGSRREPGFEGARSRRTRPLTLVLVALSIVFLSAASAYAYSARQPKIYGAETEFLLTARAELSDAAVDRATQTQTLIVTSASVLQAVADQSRMPLSTLQDAVSAEMQGRSNIMRITVADPDAKRALTLAKLVAARYAEVSVPTAAANTDPPGIRVSLLTPTRGVEQPLQPRPQRALAAGALLGLLLAAVVVVALWRPWRVTRPAPYWDEARSGD